MPHGVIYDCNWLVIILGALVILGIHQNFIYQFCCELFCQNFLPPKFVSYSMSTETTSPPSSLKDQSPNSFSHDLTGRLT